MGKTSNLPTVLSLWPFFSNPRAEITSRKCSAPPSAHSVRDLAFLFLRVPEPSAGMVVPKLVHCPSSGTAWHWGLCKMWRHWLTSEFRGPNSQGEMHFKNGKLLAPQSMEGRLMSQRTYSPRRQYTKKMVSGLPELIHSENTTLPEGEILGNSKFTPHPILHLNPAFLPG